MKLTKIIMVVSAATAHNAMMEAASKIKACCIAAMLLAGASLCADDLVTQARFCEEKVRNDAKMEIAIPRFQKPPAIDGELNEDCWRQAAKVENFVTVHEKFGQKITAAEPTEVLMGYDDQNLYLAFICHAAEPDKLVAGTHRIFYDDSVEIFLDPRNDQRSGYQLLINCKGAISELAWSVDYDAKEKIVSFDKKWKGNAIARTTIQKDRYLVEVSLPFAPLTEKFFEGNAWGINLCRNNIQCREASNWAGLVGMFHDPQKFGRLVFAGGPYVLKSVHWGDNVLGKDSVAVAIINQKGSNQRVVARLERCDDAGKTAVVAKKELKIAVGADQAETLAYDVQSGDERLVVSLCDDDGKHCYAQNKHAFEVKPILEVALVKGQDFFVGEKDCSINVKLNLGKQSLRESQLQISLNKKGQSEPLKKSSLTDLKSGELLIQLNLAGLPESAYDLVITVVDKAGKPIGDRKMKLNILEGPFS